MIISSKYCVIYVYNHNKTTCHEGWNTEKQRSCGNQAAEISGKWANKSGCRLLNSLLIEMLPGSHNTQRGARCNQPRKAILDERVKELCCM